MQYSNSMWCFPHVGSAFPATRVYKGTAIIQITATRVSTHSGGHCSPPFVLWLRIIGRISISWCWDRPGRGTCSSSSSSSFSDPSISSIWSSPLSRCRTTSCRRRLKRRKPPKKKPWGWANSTTKAHFDTLRGNLSVNLIAQIFHANHCFVVPAKE